MNDYHPHMTDAKPDAPSSLSFVRTAVVLLVLVALVLTNPLGGGDVLLKFDLVPRQTVNRWDTIITKHHVQQQQQQSLLWPTSAHPISSFTNYGLFTLGSNPTTVTIDSLFHSRSVCRLNNDDYYYDVEFQDLVEVEICKWIATHLCHGKLVLDWNGDLPIFVSRLVTVIVITFWMVSYCMHGASFASMLRRRRRNSPTIMLLLAWCLEPVASILSEGNSLTHIVGWNTFGYAALKSMDDLIATHVHSTKTNQRINFAGGCVMLLFGVGAVANQVGRLVDHRAAGRGMDGLLAACTGYAGVALQNRALLASVFGMLLDADLPFDISLKTYLWMQGGYLLLTRNYGTLATMVAGAALGQQFGNMHNEWLWKQYYTENLRSMWNDLWNKPTLFIAGR